MSVHDSEPSRTGYLNGQGRAAKPAAFLAHLVTIAGKCYWVIPDAESDACWRNESEPGRNGKMGCSRPASPARTLKENCYGTSPASTAVAIAGGTIKQISFATLAETVKKRKTKRERFLGEMEHVVPWVQLLELIEPHYPKAGKSRRPQGLGTMLRIYFMRHWLNLSDPGMEYALYDVTCMRAFAKLDLFDESMPDETTIL